MKITIASLALHSAFSRSISYRHLIIYLVQLLSNLTKNYTYLVSFDKYLLFLKELIVTMHFWSNILIFVTIYFYCVSATEMDDVLHRSKRQLLFPNSTLLQVS